MQRFKYKFYSIPEHQFLYLKRTHKYTVALILRITDCVPLIGDWLVIDDFEPARYAQLATALHNSSDERALNKRTVSRLAAIDDTANLGEVSSGILLSQNMTRANYKFG